MSFRLPKMKKGMTRADYLHDLNRFAIVVKGIQAKMPIKASSRGWAYLLETHNYITKDQFDIAQKCINVCRKKGMLPIDFVAADPARRWGCMESIDDESPLEYLKGWLEYLKDCEERYDAISFWEGRKYYLQLMVEKVDLYNLFQPICKKYFIPLGNSKGWGAILERAQMMWRFAKMERKGCTPVLLYCGDFDPDGLRISDFLKKNCMDIAEAVGWNPKNLIVERFGLNHDFIEKAGLTKIDNLMTGGKKGKNNLALPSHPNHFKPYVQEYLKKYGAWKVEANALIVVPDMAHELCENAIQKFLGKDPHQDSGYLEVINKKRKHLRDFMDDSEVAELIDKAIDEVQEGIDDGKGDVEEDDNEDIEPEGDSYA